MTTTPVVLFETKEAENATTTEYTSNNCTTEIDTLTAYNKTGANVTITVYLVASGGSAGGTNSVYEKTIAPGKTWPFPELIGQRLSSGGFIAIIAGTANALNIRATGRQYT